MSVNWEARVSTLGFWLAVLALIGAFVLLLMHEIAMPVGVLIMAVAASRLL